MTLQMEIEAMARQLCREAGDNLLYVTTFVDGRPPVTTENWRRYEAEAKIRVWWEHGCSAGEIPC